MTINELIKKVFKDSGLTYDEIAKRTGISKSTLHGYASGRSPKVPLSVIRKLTDAFDVPIEYWMTAESVPASPIREDIEDENFKNMHPIVSPKPDRKLLQEIEETAVSDKKKLMDELLQLTEWYHLGMFTKEEFEAGKKFILEMMK